MVQDHTVLEVAGDQIALCWRGATEAMRDATHEDPRSQGRSARAIRQSGPTGDIRANEVALRHVAGPSQVDARKIVPGNHLARPGIDPSDRGKRGAPKENAITRISLHGLPTAFGPAALALPH